MNGASAARPAARTKAARSSSGVPTLWGELHGHVGAYAIGTVALAAFQIALNRIDWLAKAAVDSLFHDRSAVTGAIAGMLGLAVVAFVGRVTSRWFIFNAGRDVEYDLRRRLLDHLHKLGTAFYRTMSAGEILSRSTGDLMQVRLLYGFGVLNFANVLFAFASALQVMLATSPRLTLASFAPLPILLFVTRSFSRQLYTRTKAMQDSGGRLSDVLQTNLAGIRVVRSFALEAPERARFAAANLDYLDAGLALSRLRGLMFPLAGLGSALGTLAVFWYGADLLSRPVDQGGISAGSFFAFWLAYGRMTWPMIALGFSISIVQRGRAGLKRLEAVFAAVPEVRDGPGSLPETVLGALEVKGLSFAYGEHVVLSDVSFRVEPGASLAVVGRTGSGKSTLAQLLARLLPTPPRTVYLDGRDVCDLPVSAVRGVVGYAQQDAFLFSTTVARNVALSLDEPDSDESLARVRSAVDDAQVLDEILRLPEELDTVVGERGVQLSGGQKQRVALARALVRRPKVLVLDDPLSAVDAKTEAAILRAIDRQRAERTVVLVTHRVAAASRCDAIVVLDGGKVVGYGTHEELVARGGLYAAFAVEQTMQRELEEIDLGAAAPPPARPATGGGEERP